MLGGAGPELERQLLIDWEYSMCVDMAATWMAAGTAAKNVGVTVVRMGPGGPFCIVRCDDVFI